MIRYGDVSDPTMASMSQLAAEDSNTTQISTAIEEGDVLPSMMLSYQAGPKERFTDALTSLDYLLVNELPRTWTEVCARRN